MAIWVCSSPVKAQEASSQSISQTARPITVEARDRNKVSVCASIRLSSCHFKAQLRAAVALCGYIKQTRHHLPRCRAHSMRWSFQAFVSDQPVCTLQGLCSGKVTVANCHLQSYKTLWRLNSHKVVICQGSMSKNCRSKGCGKETAVTSGWIVSKAGGVTRVL